jgi:DNA-binding transcriptional LysR family regulator
MDLELRDLRSLSVLAEHLHFGRAAEALHVSQPALSKQVRRIEERIGGPLVVRSHRGLTLTGAGVILRDRARLILAEADRAEQLSRLALRGEAGLLRIGCGLAAMTWGLPELLRRFRSTYPNVHVTVRDMSSPAQAQALAGKEIDVAFVRLPLRAAGIEAVPLFDDRLMMIWAPGRDVDWRMGLRALAEEPFVTCSRATSPSYYDHIIRTCRAAGFAPQITEETNQVFTVLHLVRAGLGVSLVPRSARLMRVPQVRFAETKVKEAAWSMGLAWRSEDESAPLVANFVRLARAARQLPPRRARLLPVR